MDQGQVPTELARWVKQQVGTLRGLTDDAANAASGDAGVARTWCLDVISQLAQVDEVARKAMYLVTAYAIREKVATATAVAQASGITISAASSRAGSATAAETLREVLGTVPGR